MPRTIAAKTNQTSIQIRCYIIN